MLDISTLALVLTVTVSMSAVVLGLLYRLHRAMPGLREWAWGNSLIALGMLLIFGRGALSSLVSIALANGFVLIGYVLLYAGCRRFIGEKPGPAGPVIAGIAWVPFLFLYDSGVYLPERIILAASGSGLLCLLCGWALRGRGVANIAAQRVASWLFAIYGLVSIGRALWVALDPPSAGILTQAGASTYLLYGWGTISNFAVTASLMILVSERLRNHLLLRVEEVEGAHRTAQRALAEQRNFLAMVSHEFCTPLAIISGAAEVVECNIAAQDIESAEELTRIRRASMRLAKLVDGCLANEWLEDASQSRRSEHEDLCAMLRNLATERAIALTVTAPCPLMVDADRYLLPIVFTNLIDNALKYGHSRDGVSICCLRWGATEVAVEVSDDGPGIDPADAPRLFEKFFRAPTAQRKPGAGLGLYLVKRIVELHGGRIELDSSAGAVFRVILPLIEEQA